MSTAIALERNGFFGPDSWYMNGAANAAYAERAKTNWRLTMPILFVHGAYDYVCETIDSRLCEPMRAHCARLSEATIPSDIGWPRRSRCRSKLRWPSGWPLSFLGFWP